jgi:hypothetical protein
MDLNPSIGGTPFNCAVTLLNAIVQVSDMPDLVSSTGLVGRS